MFFFELIIKLFGNFFIVLMEVFTNSVFYINNCDFILFVQGRLKDRWLNIRKTVSFLNAKKGGKELKEEWALQSAYQLYEHYLQDANPSHLVEAQNLLEPFNYQPPFR